MVGPGLGEVSTREMGMGGGAMGHLGRTWLGPRPHRGVCHPHIEGDGRMASSPHVGPPCCSPEAGVSAGAAGCGREQGPSFLSCPPPHGLGPSVGLEGDRSRDHGGKATPPWCNVENAAQTRPLGLGAGEAIAPSCEWGVQATGSSLML